MTPNLNANQSPTQRPTRSNRSRRTLIALLALALLLLSFLLFSQASLNLSFIQPDTLQGTLVFVALSALIFLLFVALTFVLARNLLKLFAERRIGVLGSRFRTRMVLGALVLSFLPTIFLFLFSYVLMNRSIDKWFSHPVEELREDTAQVASLLSGYVASNARAEAAAIAQSPAVRHAFDSGDFSALASELKKRQPSLQGGCAVVVAQGRSQAAFQCPDARVLAPAIEHVKGTAPAGNSDAAAESTLSWNNTTFLFSRQDVGEQGFVLVGLPLPARFTEAVARIDRSQQRYFELSQQRRLVRRFYMQLLLLLTVLMLFASSWLSLFMARLVTRPVAALAEATREISLGHLDFRVQVSAADELGELVSSFNRMAGELEQSRRQNESSRQELAQTNTALSAANDAIEKRRREIETILENIPTGVLSFDEQRRVSHSNPAFEKLFAAGAIEAGVALRNIFDAAVAQDIEHLLRRSDRMGTASREMEIRGRDGARQMEVTAASLQNGRQRLGYVVVFEDLSDLLKAQKQVAWREVARRVAHEIKNPLTPISLSAERIRRHLERAHPPDPASLAVILGCAETISGAVETVRTLVDEFSTLARFPAAQPQHANINAIVESALAMFNGRLDGIAVRTELAAGLPEVMADPEGIKRVVANLVDNAAEAMRDAHVREIHIATSLLSEGEHGMVEVMVSDTGHGVTPELKEKLFLPYFSTKDRGTGLGLAIVSRIVEEHHGSVRVEENEPVGARFIVELPVVA